MINRSTTKAILLATAAAIMPAHLFAQDANESASPKVVDEIVVTGIQLQNQRSIEQKRLSDTTAEFLVADEIARQPDYNIADAFRRVPGVFTIFDEDEGRYVGIRGLNADFTIASLNGSLIATSERGNRRVNLEAVPSSAVQRLEVFKSRTANLEGNAIGGSVNLVPRSAFQAKGLFATGSLSVGYTTEQDVPGAGFGRDSDNGPSWRGEFTVSNRFLNDKVGLLISAAYLTRRRDQQRFSVGGYGAPVNGLLTPTSALYQGYPNTITRFGGLAQLEWRPSSDLELTALVSRYTQEDRELRFGQQVSLRGTQTGIDATRNGFQSGQGLIRFNDFFIDKPLFTGQLGLKWTPGDKHVLKANLSYSEATFAEPSNEITFTTANNRTELGGTYSYADNSPVVALTSPDYFSNPANYPFTNYVFYDQDNDDYVEELGLDYGYNTARGAHGLGIDAGLQYRTNRRDFDEDRSTYTLLAGNTLTAQGFTLPDTFKGPFNLNNQLILDGAAFLKYFSANSSRFGTLTSNTAADYLFEESISAAYGQAVFKSENYKILAGLRYEQTETKVRRPRTVSGVASLVTREGKYDNLLPSVTAYYDVSPNMRLRGSYFKAIGRPNPVDLAGSESVTIGGDGVAQLSRGNPDLAAREADNFDLSLEYYLPSNQGLASVAVFRKDISNEIFRFQNIEVIDGVNTRVTQPRNVASAEVSGIEFSLVLNNLGAYYRPLKGFGVSTNFTHFDANTGVVGAGNVVLRTTDQLLQQPENVFNLSVFYKRSGLETKLTYARSGSFPSSISGSATSFEDREDLAYEQLDWTARFDLTKKIQITAEVRNITNQTRANVQTTAFGPGMRDFSSYGVTIFAGLALKL